MRKRIARVILAPATMLALAATSFAAPAAHADSETITITARVVGSAVAKAEATASASGAASSYTHVAAQVRSKARTTNKCFWSKGWNSYISGGKTIWWYDAVPSKVCKLKKPYWAGGRKATHKKVGGGTSGSACMNGFIPSNTPPARNPRTMLDVRSGTVAAVNVSAQAEVDVKATVNVTLEYTYNGETIQLTETATATGHGKDKASAKARVKVTKRTKLKATGAKIAQAKVNLRNKVSANARVKAEASAKAKAEAEINVTIVIEKESGEPVDNAPTMQCQGPQHIYVGDDAMYADFDAHDADGHAISFREPVVNGPLEVVWWSSPP